MRLLPLLSFALLLGLHEVVAQATFKTTLTICQTAYNTKKVSPVPTARKSYAVTATISFTTTSTPIVKITPTPVTRTATVTSQTTTTVNSPLTTNTVLTTSTVTSTATVTTATPVTTETITSVVTETSTQTSTYPAVVTPILDTLPGSMAKMRKRNPKEEAPVPKVRRAAAPKYPQSVTCNIIAKTVIIKTVPKTAPAKTVTLAPSTTIRTTTITKTSTKTNYPANTATTSITTTTITETATSTPPVSTTTTTTTSTSTVPGPVVTAYPQCGPRNRARTVNGDVIISGGINSDTDPRTLYGLYVDGIYDPTECCIACLEDPFCAASYTEGEPPGEGGGCAFFTLFNSCDPNDPVKLAVLIDNSYPAIDLAQNGKCGNYIEHYRGI